MRVECPKCHAEYSVKYQEAQDCDIECSVCGHVFAVEITKKKTKTHKFLKPDLPPQSEEEDQDGE